MTDLAQGPLERAAVSEVEDKIRQHNLVFWLDKPGHFTGLVDRLALAHTNGKVPYAVVPFRGSYLELMLALESFGNDLTLERVLVHVPGHNKDSIRKTPLLELYEMGHYHERALPTLIANAAAGLVARDEIEALTKRGDLTLEEAERVIAAKVGQRAGGLDAVLDQMELFQVAESVLGGSGYPMSSVKTATDVLAVRAYLNRQVGFDAGAADHVLGKAAGTTPEAMRDGLRAQLGAWLLGVEFAGDLVRQPRTPVFVELRSVAADLSRRCRDVTAHLRSKRPDLYAALATELEPVVVDERGGTTAEDLGRIDTFQFEERVILEGAISALREGRWDQVLAWAKDRAGEASFWLQRDPPRRWAWTLVEEGARLGKACASHARALEGSSRLEDAVERYATNAYEVDRAHRVFEQRWHDTKSSTLPHNAELLEIIEGLRRRYRDWADETARAFTKLCETHGFVPDSSFQQRTLFDEVVRPLAAEEGTTAVFLLDALRFEMAVDLAEALAGEAAVTVDLKARLAELPTITAVGMNALAPVARDGKLEAVVTAKGDMKGFRASGFVVNNPETRARAMGERMIGERARELKLAEVVDASPRKLKDWVGKGPRLMVVAGLEIDDAGEAGFGLGTFEHTLRQVREAWHKLSAAGVRNFVFTADHGFLLQDATTAVQVYGKKTDPDRRHVWNADAVRAEGMVSVSLAKLGYTDAPGYLLLRADTAVYQTTNARAPFVHGGNSLEERVIPVLVVKRKRLPGRSASVYEVHGVVDKPVLGVHRVRISVRLGSAATGSLGFTGATKVRVALRAYGRDDVTLRIRDAIGRATLRGGELEVPLGTDETEVFFVLDGPADDRVQVEVFPAGAAEEVTPWVSPDFFGVAGTTAPAKASGGAVGEPDAVKRSEPPAMASPLGWKDHVTDPDFQKVIAHIAEHGSLSEAELFKLVTGRRARAFVREYDTIVGKLPFRIRIEVAGGQKVYLKDGGR